MPPRMRTAAGRGLPSIDRRPSRSEPFPVDVEDRGEEFLVSADLPGLRKQDINVDVRTDRLQIVASFDTDTPGTYRRKERMRGDVRRVIHLREPFDEKHVSALYSDGVLSITLKKRRRPTQVDIR